MTRRKFIVGLFIMAVAAIGGTIFIISFDKILERILKDQLAFLQLQDGSVESFVNDTRAVNYYENKNFGWKKQLFVRIYHFFDNKWIPLPGNDRYSQYCTFFVNDFLLSTDFFNNKMDESIPVHYIALFEPYKRPCSNPFSNLFYPAA